MFFLKFFYETGSERLYSIILMYLKLRSALVHVSTMYITHIIVKSFSASSKTCLKKKIDQNK